MEMDPVADRESRRRRPSALFIAAVCVFSVIVPGPLVLLALGSGRACAMEPRDKARMDITALCAAIDSYELSNDGQLPASLDALLVPDSGGSTHLKNRTVIPVDPWGQPYRFGVRVFSTGGDGKPGGSGDDADIDNFSMERRTQR